MAATHVTKVVQSIRPQVVHIGRTRVVHTARPRVVHIVRPSLVQYSAAGDNQIIRFTGPKVKKHCPSLMRRIEAWDDKNQKIVVFLTNHLRFGATTIGAIYRDRWEIELFFKVLKQHLKIKTFVGTSPNALKTQIWTALIAILLFKYMQFKSKCTLPLCRLVALLRLNLFTYRSLWPWLDDPFEVPPEEPPAQLGLAF